MGFLGVEYVVEDFGVERFEVADVLGRRHQQVRHFQPAELLDLGAVGVVAEEVAREGPFAGVDQRVDVFFVGLHVAQASGGG